MIGNSEASLYLFSYHYHQWFKRVWWIPPASAVFLGLVVLGWLFAPVSLPAVSIVTLTLAAGLLLARQLTRRTLNEALFKWDWNEWGAVQPPWKQIAAAAGFMIPPWVWWSLAGGLAATGAITLGSTLAPQLPAWFWINVMVVAWLIAVWLIACLLWLAVSSWHSVTFRRLAWWGAVAFDKFRGWMLTGWRGALVMLSAVTVLMWVYAQFTGQQRPLIEFLTPDLALRTVAVTVLIVVSYWAYEARRRIVVVPFTDYTGQADLKTCVESIGPQLRNELDGLAQLYQIIEDVSAPEWSISAPKKPDIPGTPLTAITKIGARIAAETGQTLQGIVSAESKIKLGVLEIPVGAIMAVLGRILEGPRVTGSLHRAGDEWVLMATLSGGGLNGNWRVSQADVGTPRPVASHPPGKEQPPADAGTGAVVRMVEQMVYRIFTDLEQRNLGTPRWRAVYLFTEGLRAYRETLRTRRNSSLNLHRAEQAFLQALAEDQEFAQCHYNLGIIYNSLNRPDSAREAYTRAIRQDLGLFDAYYALALDAWQSDRYQEAARYCDQMILLKPHEARAWNLKGTVLFWASAFGEGAIRKDETLVLNAVAVALAWRAMCRSARAGQVSERQKHAVVRCLSDLATNRQGEAGSGLVRQAIQLAPPNSGLYLTLATALACEADWRGAKRALSHALLEAEDLDWVTSIIRDRQKLFAPGNRWRTRVTERLYLQLDDEIIQAWQRAMRNAWAMPDWRLDAALYVLSSTESCPFWFSVPLSLQAHLDKRDPHKTFAKTFNQHGRALSYGYKVEPLKPGVSWQVLDGRNTYIIRKAAGALNVHFPRAPIHDIRRDICRILRMRHWLQKQPDGAALERRLAVYRKRNDQWLAAQMAIRLTELNLDTLPAKAEDYKRNDQWLAAQMAIRLTELNLETLPAKAEDYIKQAIEWLEKDYALEVQGRGLKSYRALACLSQNKMGQALHWAEQAVALDPESAWERQVLGQVYFALNDYERARLELTLSLNLDPENADTMRLIALTFWYRSVSIRKLEERHNAFDQAVEAFGQILQVVENQDIAEENLVEQIQTRGWAHYGLGWFYGELGQYDSAIAHFQIALAAQYKPLELRVYIGYTHMRASVYEQAEQYFREAGVEALRHYHRLKTQARPKAARKKRAHRTKTLDRFDPAVGEEEPIHTWLVEAHLYSALALAERGVNLRQAVRRASHALRHIIRMDDREDYSEYMAVYFECMGWIYFRAAQSPGLAHAHKTRWLNRAMLDLEHSVSLLAAADTCADAYYRLAQIYAAQAVYDPVNKDHWQAKAKEAGQHCTEADLRGKYTAEIDRLLQPQKPDTKPDLVVQVNRKDVDSGSQSK